MEGGEAGVGARDDWCNGHSIDPTDKGQLSWNVVYQCESIDVAN